MRFRSKTNSRKGEDLALRRDYKRRHLGCELTPLFERLRMNTQWALLPACDGDTLIPSSAFSSDVNHIAVNSRHDVLSNVIALSRMVHDWFHAHRADGTALCVLCKIRKDEFDWDEMSRITRKDWRVYFELLEPKLQFDVGRRAWREVMDYLKGERP